MEAEAGVECSGAMLSTSNVTLEHVTRSHLERFLYVSLLLMYTVKAHTCGKRAITVNIQSSSICYSRLASAPFAHGSWLIFHPILRRPPNLDLDELKFEFSRK